MPTEIMYGLYGRGPCTSYGKTNWRTVTSQRSRTSTIFIVLGAILGMQEDHLRRLAATDGLAGLLNRRYFSLRLSQEVAHAKRY